MPFLPYLPIKLERLITDLFHRVGVGLRYGRGGGTKIFDNMVACSGKLKHNISDEYYNVQMLEKVTSTLLISYDL